MKIANGLTLTFNTKLTTNHFYKYILLCFLTIIFSQNATAQGCAELPSGIAVSEISSNGTNCDYEIDLCVEVPNSPRPKRIDYEIVYDSNGDGTKDANMFYSFSPGGKIPAGTHCLSAMAPSEAFIVKDVLCGTAFDVIIIGYTNNSGGGGGDCATTLGTITEEDGFQPLVTALPVELVSFYGKSSDDNNSLIWTTASEKDVDYFIIEKMGKGESEFSEIGRMVAVGNSASMETYEWFDYEPTYFDYYRLNMVDVDGTSEYSNIINVRQAVEGFRVLSISPNPVESYTTMKYTALSKTAAVDIFNQQGQLILQMKLDVEEGLNELEMDLSELTAGMYFLNITDGRTSIQRKITKIRS